MKTKLLADFKICITVPLMKEKGPFHHYQDFKLCLGKKQHCTKNEVFYYITDFFSKHDQIRSFLDLVTFTEKLPNGKHFLCSIKTFLTMNKLTRSLNIVKY